MFRVKKNFSLVIICYAIILLFFCFLSMVINKPIFFYPKVVKHNFHSLHLILAKAGKFP